MINTDTSHLPSTEDITIDSLEYLFAPAQAVDPTPIPWVHLDIDPDQVLKHNWKLQSRVELLEQQNHNYIQQLQNICVMNGYLQALLTEKDEQLKVLPDLRFRAAESVALRLESQRCKEKIEELQEVVERLNQRHSSKLEEIFKRLKAHLSAEEMTTSILMWLGFAALTAILLIVVLLM